MKLDIGCGIRKEDRLIPNALHCDLEHGKYTQMICDIQHLPFKNKCFEKSYSYHTLEHILDPIQAIRELIRVTTTFLEVEIPHRYSKRAKSGTHITFFKCDWFKKVLKNFRYHVWSYYTGWLQLPFFGRMIIRVNVYLETPKGKLRNPSEQKLIFSID